MHTKKRRRVIVYKPTKKELENVDIDTGKAEEVILSLIKSNIETDYHNMTIKLKDLEIKFKTPKQYYNALGKLNLNKYKFILYLIENQLPEPIRSNTQLTINNYPIVSKVEASRVIKLPEILGNTILHVKMKPVYPKVKYAITLRPQQTITNWTDIIHIERTGKSDVWRIGDSIRSELREIETYLNDVKQDIQNILEFAEREGYMVTPMKGKRVRLTLSKDNMTVHLEIIGKNKYKAKISTTIPETKTLRKIIEEIIDNNEDKIEETVTGNLNTIIRKTREVKKEMEQLEEEYKKKGEEARKRIGIPKDEYIILLSLLEEIKAGIDPYPLIGRDWRYVNIHMTAILNGKEYAILYPEELVNTLRRKRLITYKNKNLKINGKPVEEIVSEIDPKGEQIRKEDIETLKELLDMMTEH